MSPPRGSVGTTEAKEWLASLIGNAPFGILALDLDGYCTLSNARAARALGLRVDDVIDRKLRDILELWPELAARIPPIRESGRVGFDCDRVVRGERIYTVRGRLIVNGMLVTIDDITVEMQARGRQETLLRNLELANRELAEFAYICAHDMKSPVSSMLGLIEVIEEGEELSEETLAILAMLRRSAEGLDGTVRSLNEVLAFKRTLGSSPELVGVARVLEETLESLARPIRETSAELSLDVPADLLVRVRSVHLKSILLNLVGNALKYRHDQRPPRIGVRMDASEERLTIEVEDNGLGLDTAKVENRLFGLFNRFHSHVEGHGVGLYLTKSIVDSYDGRITLDSAEGRGSTFRIELPHAA